MARWRGGRLADRVAVSVGVDGFSSAEFFHRQVPGLRMPIDWSPLAEIVHSRERFVLTTHVRPDADAIGSELGMAGILEHLGKDVLIANASAIPDRLKFLDPSGKCRQLGKDVTEEQALATDVHMVLDTSAWGQLAEMGNVFRRTNALKVCIDHHASSEDIGARDFKDVVSEATGTLVYQFAEYLGVPVSPAMASALYCAIATDTGWFRFPSTRKETMRIIGELIERGAKPHELYEELYEKSSAARLKLVSRALGRATVECEGRIAWTYVRWDDYAETGADPSDTEDLVNECLKIKGTVAAFICIEQSNRNIKTSFRSRLPVDISRVAEQFKGGGHKQAAGAILPGPLGEASTKVLTAIRATLFA